MINCGEYLFNIIKQLTVLLQSILMMLCIIGKYIQILDSGQERVVHEVAIDK
jgi:hypothetical protein